MKVYILIFLSILVGANTALAERPLPNLKKELPILVGTLDQFDNDALILSDRFIPVSKLVNCFGISGSKLVSCSSIKRGSWIQVSLQAGKNIVSSKVVEIRELSEAQAISLNKELNNDD